MVKTLQLTPVRETPEFFEDIEREIIRVFKKWFYLPLLREFDHRSLQNAAESLVQALLTGKVTFNLGVFSGSFSAKVSQDLRALGAKWDRKSSSFRLDKKSLPSDVLHAISSSSTQFERKIRRIVERLAEISPEDIAEKMRTERLFDRTLWEMDRRVARTMKKLRDVKLAAKRLQVQPVLTPERRARIAAEWQDNMKLWIQDFTKKEIRELRGRLQDSVFAGNRYESAIHTIEDSYGVTQRKAKFLASQETRLLLCKFKQTRYEEAGVRQYKWKSVTGTALHPVRPRHKELNDESQIRGKIFRFDQPPISTGAGEPARRNNPGEDYNCRCVSIPVVDFRE